ncbi:MAG: hypothetical protein CMJ98_07225 [Planctomycetes bacterium]|nr:hypothetical protein [Planctomycetota bacterium]
MQRRLLAIGCLFAVLGWGAATNAEPGRYFIAIHCDPQYADAADWNALGALVAAAEGYDQVLTIQLNPQWGPIIASALDGPGDIAHWATDGHEIGGHHHVLTHPGGWDGYSNQPEAETASGYLGDMDQWLADLEAILPGSIVVRTVASKDFDFPAGVEFQTGGTGSTPGPASATSTPVLKNLAGGQVWNINHGALIAGGTWQVDEMMTAFDAATSDEVFGVAVHPHDYYEENHEEVDRWLAFLHDRDPDASRSYTAGAVLQENVDSLPAVPSSSSASRALQIGTLLTVGILASWPSRGKWWRRRQPNPGPGSVSP